MESKPQAFWLDALGKADAFTTWVFEQARPHLGRSVLEIGCGSGTYTRLLAASAATVQAVEIDERFVAEAQAATRGLDNVTVRKADAAKERYQQEFDTVLMLDVLEHIEDDRTLLRNLAEALRPEGRLILKVPAFPWLFGTMDQAVGHHRRYTREDLAARLVDSGFHEPEMWYFNAAAIPGWWLNGVVLKRVTPPASQLTWFERVLPVVKTIDRVVRPLMGLSLFAVARKSASG